MSGISLELDRLSGQTLLFAKGKNRFVYEDCTVSYEKICLVMQKDIILIDTSNDTDEILASIATSKEVPRWGKIKEFENFQNNSLSWFWNCKNNLGFHDGIIISFTPLMPQLLLYAISSRIRIYGISEVMT